MKNRVVATLISLFLVCGAVGMRFNRAAQANPIPIPVIMMPEEYINATISLGDHGVAYAEVDGLYPFKNIGYENVTMYYPVPPNSSEITVMMNDTVLEWRYSDGNYSTVVGEFPMIEWLINPAPDSFEIRTHYSHFIMKDGSYSFLYAMGTGRYLESYAKQTTAYVSINVSKDFAPTERNMDLHALRYDKGASRWLWNPVNYTITQSDDSWLISLTKTSELFRPLVEDLLVRISPCGTVSGANDGLELTMHVDKTRITIGEVVDINMTLRNAGNESIRLVFGSSQTFDIYLRGGLVFARWSDGCVFLFLVWDGWLDPNQTITKILDWNFFLYNPSNFFNFSGSGFIPPPPGMYTLSGYCVGRPENLSMPWTYGLSIELVLPDINHDGRVDIIDVAIAAKAFGSSLGESRWNVEADVQEDGTINIVDLSIIAKSFGKTF